MQRPETNPRLSGGASNTFVGEQSTTANSHFIPLKQTAPSRQKSFLIQGVGKTGGDLSGTSCARHGAQAAKIA